MSTQVILSPAEIAHMFNVSESQMDACERVLDESGVFFQCKSSQYQENSLVYELRWHCEHTKLSCTCPAGNPPRDKYGVPTRPLLNCWHKRACQAVEFEAKQQERIALEKEAEQAAALRRSHLASYERRTGGSLGSQGFTMLKSQPVSMRGYDIRYRTAADTWLCRKAHGLAPVGHLPQEWQDVCNDPEVVEAVCFPTSQRSWRADRRRHSAEYRRSSSVVSA